LKPLEDASIKVGFMSMYICILSTWLLQNYLWTVINQTILVYLGIFFMGIHIKVV